jgi:hypothetical protein
MTSPTPTSESPSSPTPMTTRVFEMDACAEVNVFPGPAVALRLAYHHHSLSSSSSSSSSSSFLSSLRAQTSLQPSNLGPGDEQQTTMQVVVVNARAPLSNALQPCVNEGTGDGDGSEDEEESALGLLPQRPKAARKSNSSKVRAGGREVADASIFQWGSCSLMARQFPPIRDIANGRSRYDVDSGIKNTFCGGGAIQGGNSGRVRSDDDSSTGLVDLRLVVVDAFGNPTSTSSVFDMGGGQQQVDGVALEISDDLPRHRQRLHRRQFQQQQQQQQHVSDDNLLPTIQILETTSSSNDWKNLEAYQTSRPFLFANPPTMPFTTTTATNTTTTAAAAAVSGPVMNSPKGCMTVWPVSGSFRIRVAPGTGKRPYCEYERDDDDDFKSAATSTTTTTAAGVSGGQGGAQAQRAQYTVTFSSPGLAPCALRFSVNDDASRTSDELLKSAARANELARLDEARLIKQQEAETAQRVLTQAQGEVKDATVALAAALRIREPSLHPHRQQQQQQQRQQRQQRQPSSPAHTAASVSATALVVKWGDDTESAV